MKAISVSVPAANNLSTKKVEKPISDAIRTRIPKSYKDESMHKSLLLCNLCSWSVSYTDYSDSLDMMHEYAAMTCPVCKDGRIKSSMMVL
jgi:hypothetical protein